MGCFSYLCHKCGKGILSNGFRGEHINLFLLKEGRLIERMIGEYNSYGSVFDNNGDSYSWKNMEWQHIVDLHFNRNKHDGICAIHTKCFDNKIPKCSSDNDPNQGWGEDGDLERPDSFFDKQYRDPNMPPVKGYTAHFFVSNDNAMCIDVKQRTKHLKSLCQLLVKRARRQYQEAEIDGSHFVFDIEWTPSFKIYCGEKIFYNARSALSAIKTWEDIIKHQNSDKANDKTKEQLIKEKYNI